MSTPLQNISRDILIYSVLASDFERLDFKDDALAGVRANYFNAHCAPQAEKTDILVDGKPHSLSYALRSGEPLAWKMMCGNRPVQTVNRASDGSYSVISYGDNGVIFKRQYFDGNHLWLRTEYYDRTLENRLAAVIRPQYGEDTMMLRRQLFSQDGVDACDLYPSLTAPKQRCAALVYSNAGMVWFDARFRPAQTAPADNAKAEGGFRFTKEAFLSAGTADVLELQNAPYLSEEDVLQAGTPVYTPDVPQEYSAYDKIAEILFEAQKTNKNLFGELASLNPQPEPEEDPLEEAPAAAEAPAEQQPEPEKTAEPVAVEAATSAGEPAPTSEIATRDGAYAYYGALDENHLRTGRGRTVTPDGVTAYEGDYVADKRDGFGVCYYKEGSPNYVGDWKSGNRSGRGVGFRRSDGTIHVGKWHNNKPDSFGARFDREGNFIDVCTYVNGKRNGKSVSFDADGNLVVKIWKNGELVSEKIIS